MSKTKQGGSTKLGRDSAAQRLGIKASAGETVKIGDILVRQRGTHYLCGDNVKKGSDDTIYSMVNGKVFFETTSKQLFNGKKREARVVGVIPTPKAPKEDK
jgi:large subunit ribosomal protein L27